MRFDIGILQMAGQLAQHAAARQNVIAANIANADTPGFKARDIAPFAEIFAAGGMSGATGTPETFESAALGAEDPNGNTVSLPDQMVRAAEVRMENELALGIYAKSLAILRAGLGRIR